MLMVMYTQLCQRSTPTWEPPCSTGHAVLLVRIGEAVDVVLNSKMDSENRAEMWSGATTMTCVDDVTLLEASSISISIPTKGDLGLDSVYCSFFCLRLVLTGSTFLV